MEKSKRVSLGVQKKNKSTTKQNKKKLLSSVLDYLKSDTCMFATLVSHSPPASASGMKLKEPIKEKKKRVLKMVGDYMKSDTYMYSPFLSSNLMPASPQGTSLDVIIQKRCSALGKSLSKLRQQRSNTESANVIAEKEPCEYARPGLSIADNQTTWHGETVKHMVYQRCCSAPVSGKATADVQLRQLVVE